MKYSALALAFVLSASPVKSFQNQHRLDTSLNRVSETSRRIESLALSVASSSSPSSAADFNDASGLSDALNSVTNAARDTITKAVAEDIDETEAEIAQKRKMVENRMKKYKVTLPLTSNARKSTILSIGMKLRQVNSGRSFDSCQLNLDSLELEEMNTEMGEKYQSFELMDEQGLARRIDGGFQGIVVSSVQVGSAAWTAGVRAGDILQATSATMGNQIWPKSTIDGVRSVLQSRMATSGSIEMEFQRLGDAIDNQFELTLTKPIGLKLKESEDGYVSVTGFTENAPNLVRYAVKVGDRVLAVDSALGEKMWPVSTVEGVISATTSRLPGQEITFRFERPVENLESTVDTPITSLPDASKKEAVTEVDNSVLLKRCREVIKRYTKGENGSGSFVKKYNLPSLVADKVVDALASAGAKVDGVTLSMIMTSYLSCRQPRKAIQLFEACVGLNANGSASAPTAEIVDENGKKIVANEFSLDVFTVSALLKAHAMDGDLSSVLRTLAAAEGGTDESIDGLDVASWKNPLDSSLLKLDTRCYNTVLSAVAKSGSEDGLNMAFEIFDAMAEPNQTQQQKQKDLYSYNIMLSALSRYGMYQEVVELFYKMKGVGLKADKVSYTALSKAITSDIDVEGDIEELFYDMKEKGIVPDAITFNTAIKSLCNQRRISVAKRIVTIMEGCGVMPDSMTYGLLMKGLIDTGNPSASLTLFETACSDQRTVALTENTYIYTTAIAAAASLGDHERALDLLARMRSLGVPPNLKTLTALMGACITAGKADIAVDVYKQIPNPDGYATMQGIQALSAAGDVSAALKLIDGSTGAKLSGKQVMRSFENMIRISLERDDFDMARKVLTSLIRSGNIPSKAIYKTAFDAMKLLPKKRRAFQVAGETDELGTEKFQFLLFVLDSIASRNLPCEGMLYSTILFYGSKVGGLPRKMASLLVTAKADFATGKDLLSGNDSSARGTMFMAWEELFLRYNEMKGRIAADGPPPLVVRSGKRDLTSILRAEKDLSFRRSEMV